MTTNKKVFVKVTNNRWASDEVICTLSELQKQANEFTQERKGKYIDSEDHQEARTEFQEYGPVTLSQEIREGQDVIVDDKGETVGAILTDGQAE